MIPKLKLPDPPYLGYQFKLGSYRADDIISKIDELVKESNHFILPDNSIEELGKRLPDFYIKPSAAPYRSFIVTEKQSLREFGTGLSVAGTATTLFFSTSPTKWLCATWVTPDGCSTDFTNALRVEVDGGYETYALFMMRGEVTTEDYCSQTVRAVLGTLERLGYYLDHHHTETEVVPRCTSAQNEKRLRKGKKPLLPYTVIRIGESRGGGRGGRMGIEISPHDRRGHYRHYKNGRVVWIDSIKVKGGASSPKEYRIVE